MSQKCKKEKDKKKKKFKTNQTTPCVYFNYDSLSMCF